MSSPKPLPDKLQSVVDRSEVILKPAESEAERTSRLLREEAREHHERWRESVLFGAILVVVLALILVTAWTAFFAGSITTERQALAGSTLSVLVSGAAGYLFGRAAAN